MRKQLLFEPINKSLKNRKIFSGFFYKALVLVCISLSNLSMKGGGPLIGINVFPNDTICLGNSINLTFSSSRLPTQFQYYVSGGVLGGGNTASANIVFTTPGQYTVMVIGQASDGTGWASRIITVLPSPNVSLNLSFSNICQNNQQPLSGGSPSGGVYWGTCVNQNTFYTSCNLDSNYIFYTFVDSMGCENTDSNLVRIENCATSLEFKNKSEFAIYPNPAQNNFTIDLVSDNNNQAIVELYNSTGQIVLKQEISKKTEIDVSQYSQGIYNVKIDTGKELMSKKIIIQH